MRPRWAAALGSSALVACSGHDLVCPYVAPPEGALTLAVIGDYGTNDGDEEDVAALVHCLEPAHVVTVGDNVYIGPEDIDDAVGRHYGDYIGGYGAGPSENRFWPAAGNHDYEDDGLAAYLAYFTLPGNERYYDVDLGRVHLFVVDSNEETPDGATLGTMQAAWLEAALGASTACYDVVAFHHPPFSSGDGHGSHPHMQWPFAAWGADAVFAGHDHVYERLEVDGIPYFVDGIGGRGLHGFDEPLAQSRFRYDDDHGAMLVTATGSGIRYQLFDANGTLIDDWLVGTTCPQGR